MSNHAKAGNGNPHKYTILVDNTPSAPQYAPDKHYIGIDAVVWFVNDQSNFFTDRMVAGTIEITLNGQNFPVVLGQYELKGGQQVAPIFDRALITSVPYRSGNIVLKAVIQGNRQNTMVGTLLKQMAVATITAVAGAVSLETGGVGGAALAAAGGTLVKGAQQVLSDNDDKKVNIFNPFEITIHPVEDLRGTQSYILLHKGTDDLVAAEFAIASDAAGMDVQYDGRPFRDGAWLLLRLRRNDTYLGDPRPWLSDVDGVMNALDELIDSWNSSLISVEEVKRNLVKSASETPSVADQVGIATRRIRSDEALILSDRRKYAAVLRAYLQAAINSAGADDPRLYYDAVAAIEGAVRKNAPQPLVLTDAIVTEFNVDCNSGSEFSAADAQKVSFRERFLQ
ncbi:MAG: hypothetical protein WBQ23_00495 [Bacteroidota bacterium]